MIQLGSLVKDKISGFQGVAVCRSVFLNGCVRISIQPPMDKDGKFVDERWFDEQQIEVLEAAAPVESRSTGGPVDSRPPAGQRA